MEKQKVIKAISISMLTTIVGGLFAFVVFLFTTFSTNAAVDDFKTDISKRLDRIERKLDRVLR